ncbi:MAG: TetR/AcrR family transcriptional regulator, tetracycline repressor protein [Mycobacterium sp.]|nr:TetR/AcrR family transcriptional regulator, tetracycline repressor protein [Mycobacterium sp.]
MAKRRSAIERAPLTRELIAAEAADLIRQEGLEALTMRTVAATLGVSAMALYHHVEDKDEIIRLVGDDILAKIDLPDAESGDWRELLIEAVTASHEALLSVPGMVSVMLTRKLLPNARRLLVFCIRQFERAGLSEEEAKLAYAGLHQLSIGRLMVESSSNFVVHTHVPADDDLIAYMDALHSRASFEGALTGLLDHYTPSAPRRRSAPRKTLATPRKAPTKRVS